MLRAEGGNHCCLLSHQSTNTPSADLRRGSVFLFWIQGHKLKNLASHRMLPLIPHIEKLLLEERRKQEYYMGLLRDGYNRDYLEDISVTTFTSYNVTANFYSHLDYNSNE